MFVQRSPSSFKDGMRVIPMRSDFDVSIFSWVGCSAERYGSLC